MTSKQDINPSRTRTITWVDPSISARNPQAISGLEYLRSIRDGIITPPPVAKLIGYKIRDVEEGRAVFELKPEEYHYNPFATVHGGIVSTLLDSTITASILSTLPIGQSCSTVEFKTNFIRPITAQTGTVRCVARKIHIGKRLATAEGQVVDVKGILYAHAVSTLMIF
ncbi:MAG: PaaI family thioesterase [Deltaproteobacteria bacterium]|nr:PaaI family thioesterase [Deltaproteobacteria bacterium]